MSTDNCSCQRGPIRFITIKPRQQSESSKDFIDNGKGFYAYGSCNRSGCVPVYLGSGTNRRDLANEMQARFAATWRGTTYL